MKRLIQLILLILVFHLRSGVKAQDLDSHLEIFKPLLGKTWTGYFQNPEITEMTHICKWEIIQGGRAVRQNKQVPEANFSLEITYYYDRIEETLKFLTISSNGYISNGTVTSEDNKIVTQGFQQGPDRTNTFKLTLEVGEDGSLHDYYYSLVDDNWKPGHYIKYSAGD